MAKDILIIPSSSNNPRMEFSGSDGNTIYFEVAESGSVHYQSRGSGSLFSIVDTMSGSIMSVNDISGLPILEVFSNDKVVAGAFNKDTFIVEDDSVTIGSADTSGSVIIRGSQLDVSGTLNITGDITGSSFTGSFVGDGTGLTNVTAVTASYSLNNLQEILDNGSSALSDMTLSGSAIISGSANIIGLTSISGSLIVSSSANDTAQFRGSDSDILRVVGSEGVLWTVTDSLSGSLFSVGDISGISQFEVDSAGDVFTGDKAQIQTLNRSSILVTSVNVTESITALSTASYDGAFFDYVLQSGSNAVAGRVSAVWNGGSTSFTNDATADIGSSTSIILSVDIVAGTAALRSVTTTSAWTVKVNTRAL